MSRKLPGVIGVHHIGVSVPDLDKAREFYFDILGAVEEVEPLSWADNPFIDRIVGLEGSAARQFFCRLGNVQIEVFEYSAPRQAPLAPGRGVNEYGYTHFAIQVEDLEAVHERIVAAGLPVHAPPDMSSITVDADGTKHGYSGTYCRDFFGNVFEILEIHETPEILPI
ncbi:MULTISPECIES: VOC family protein [Novosphingobium]|uniref:Catechol 2,3-dioxygenase n=1 Tax=Novosphingobium mathurense TaxID=428990 RepID=A0A1U6ISW0_9SPHN|nr:MULTISPECIES: VOC family protein [Novosphingobium]CDO38710.1 Glyoxalase/bleomycin resistance protein/dioxygenase [Novosphingobium sp. KN65.2]SLK11054.1 Catechol 2,3-dioxygenase [Novosphingobium mathurense]